MVIFILSLKNSWSFKSKLYNTKSLSYWVSYAFYLIVLDLCPILFGPIWYMHCFNDLMNLVDLYIIIIHWPSHLLAFVPLDVTDPVPTGKEPHQSSSQSLLALNVSLTTFLSFFSCLFYDNSFIIIIFSFICHKNLKKSNLIFHIDNNNIYKWAKTCI